MGRSVSEPWGRSAVILLGGLAPLATTPFLPNSTMSSWLLVVQVGVGCALLAPGSGRLPHGIQIALGVALGWFGLVCVFSATPMLSLLGRYPRYEGLVSVAGYGLALLAGARILGERSALRSRFVTALAVSGMASLAIAAVQAVAFPASRVVGWLGNSSILATWALVVLAVVGWHALTSPSLTTVMGTAASLGVLVLAASRAAWLGVVVMAGCGIVVRSMMAAPRPRWWPIAAMPVVAGIGILLTPGAQARLVGSSPMSASTASGRWQLWQDSWSLVTANPLVGVGGSRFVDVIGRFHDSGWAATVGPYAPPDSPHSLPLQVLAVAGFPGLLAVLWLAFTIGRSLLHGRAAEPWQVSAGLAGTAIVVSQGFGFTDPVTTTLGLLILGGAVGHHDPAARTSRWTRGLWLVWMAVAVWLAGTAVVAEARFDAVVRSPASTTQDLADVAQLRAWDPDLSRRLGGAILLAAESGADPTPAVSLLRSACQAVPESVECQLTLADALTVTGAAADAVDILRDASWLDPGNVDLHLKLGIALAETGDVAGAEAALRHAAQLRPSAAEPWDNLAVLWHSLGRESDALAAEAEAASRR